MNSKFRSVFISRTRLGKQCLEKLISLNHKPEAIISLKDEYKTVLSDFEPFDDLAEKYNISLYKIDDIRFWKKVFGINHKKSLLRSKENIKLIKS